MSTIGLIIIIIVAVFDMTVALAYAEMLVMFAELCLHMNVVQKFNAVANNFVKLSGICDYSTDSKNLFFY